MPYRNAVQYRGDVPRVDRGGRGAARADPRRIAPRPSALLLQQDASRVPAVGGVAAERSAAQIEGVEEDDEHLVVDERGGGEVLEASVLGGVRLGDREEADGAGGRTAQHVDTVVE